MLRAGSTCPVRVALFTVVLASCPLAVAQTRAATQDPPPGEGARIIAASRPSGKAEAAEQGLLSIIALSTGLPVLDGSGLIEVQDLASWDLDFCEWIPASQDPAEDASPAELLDAALWSSRPASAADALVP